MNTLASGMNASDAKALTLNAGRLMFEPKKLTLAAEAFYFASKESCFASEAVRSRRYGRPAGAYQVSAGPFRWIRASGVLVRP